MLRAWSRQDAKRRDAVAFVRGIAILALVVAASLPIRAADPPAPLPDAEYWRIVSEFSERAGTFQSDNLLSNERWLQHVIPDLVAKAAKARPNRVYVGVGPEQNFTYIAALKPSMAFIVDIRRGNFDLHLMYKALFELSADRAEFVSRLFCRPRPAGLTAASTIDEIFAAYEKVESSDTLYSRNMRAIVNLLTKTHGFLLSSADILRLQHIFNAIYVYGPGIQVLDDADGRPAADAGADVCGADARDRPRRVSAQLPGNRGTVRVREGLPGREPAHSADGRFRGP